MTTIINQAHLANSILEFCFRNKEPINAMKLQKMMYIATAVYANFKNEYPLSESFSAWQYGPVLVSLHDYYKVYNGGSITGYQKDVHGKALTFQDNLFKTVATTVYETFKVYSNKEIAEVTMVKNSGWERSYNDRLSLIPHAYVIEDRSFHKLIDQTSNSLFISSSL